MGGRECRGILFSSVKRHPLQRNYTNTGFVQESCQLQAAPYNPREEKIRHKNVP